MYSVWLSSGCLSSPTLRLCAERYDAIMAIMLASLREERQQTYSCFLPIHPETGRVLYVPIKHVDAKDATITFDELQSLNPDGVFFSNGPGDPEQADPEVNLLRQVLDAGYPFFGICFGNQLLGRALGFGTYKLKFGHRGINQPVKDMTTGKIEITAHNHGFAVDAPIGETVDAPFENGKYGKVFVSHIDLNDDVVEGLQCVDIPAFSVQYHPEAAAGPHDAAYLFDRFVDLMRSVKEGTRNA